MLPVETTCFNKTLIMTARKHGHKPAQRLGWATLAYHKQKGAAPDPGCTTTACRMMGRVELVEELCEEVKMVRGFCYLGDRVNAR